MKQCPVCQSLVFDDIDTCYGCMHRFDMDRVESHSLGSSSGENPSDKPQLSEVVLPKASSTDVGSASIPQVPMPELCTTAPPSRDATMHDDTMYDATAKKPATYTTAPHNANAYNTTTHKSVTPHDTGAHNPDSPRIVPQHFDKTKPPHAAQQIEIPLDNHETVRITIEVSPTACEVPVSSAT